MRVPRIFTPQDMKSGQTIILAEAQSHYLLKVLRLQVDRELVLFNGQGGEFHGQIKAAHKKYIEVLLGEFIALNRQSPLELELAIGVSRGERMDWVLQKATELGVTRITPLVTEYTEVKVSGERQAKKMHHWQQIIISACEQSQRNLLPVLAEPVALNTWLMQVKSEVRLVLHHRDSQGFPERSMLQSISLLIGPEGGLSDSEIAQAQAQQFQPLTLGPRVLRTETAPVAAISLVQYLWGDFT